MKRVIVVGVALVLCAGVTWADRATLDDTKTQQALPLPQPPTIDGIIDTAVGEWTFAGGASQGGQNSAWRVTVNESLEDLIQGGNAGDRADVPFDNIDLSYEVFVGYDADNLYVALRVSDDFLGEDSAAPDSANGSTWEDDSVEVFIDGDNSNFDGRDTTGTNAEIVDTGGQFVITVANAYRDAEAGSPGFGPDAAWYAKTDLTDTGYEAEFRISMDIIGNPQTGDVIGFTVGVNDDDDDGPGEYQVVWQGAVHNEITYGNLLLGPLSYTAPKAAAPTIDGVINDGEYDGAEEIQVNPFTAMYDTEAGDDFFEAADHSYSAWIVHDDAAVYVGVDVTDDLVVNDSADAGTEDGTTWEDDSVEILFDADDSNDSGRGSGQFEGQFVFTPNGAWRDAEANNPFFGSTADDDWFAATSTTATGYQVEFMVKKTNLFEPEDGTVMGFTMTINDDDGSGRKAQPMWAGRAHNELSYGDLTLAPESGAPVDDWSVF